MQHDLIAKQANKLIESVYRMEANEQKIILLAIQLVNEMERGGISFTADTEIVLHAHQYAKAFGVSRPTAFEILCEAKNSIYERSFEIDYVDAQGVVKPTSSRWIHRKGEMKSKSEISLFFAPAVIPYIYAVKDEFTLLDLKEIGRLKSKYAIRLYKLLMKWRNAKFQPKFEYDELRLMLGLDDDEYLMKADFKKRVLDIAVTQINAGTGFVNLKYNGFKTGKVITHFQFNYDKYDDKTLNVTPIKETKNKPLKKPSIKTLSESQIYLFSKTIAKNVNDCIDGFGYLSTMVSPNQDEKSLAKKIENDLKNGIIEPYEKALILAGFVDHSAKKNSKPPVDEDNQPENAQNEQKEPLVDEDKGSDADEANQAKNVQDEKIEQPENPINPKITKKEATGDLFMPEKERAERNHYDIPEHVMAKYVSAGGEMSKDELIEIAKKENKASVALVVRMIGELNNKKNGI
ncbi:RepB family plasmid replication initiator protein [Acinetobacter sp. CFCC 10889]|uniref:RepB family plasmid replication initiator protein n=1 Tax=Acinetobacter sp. CFCC 10889 TaxID=1775557 RepID=UPI000DCFE9A4|nr:RepB family plasmid replication initiator protein [Acinetobacter sp. CFCC 10889]